MLKILLINVVKSIIHFPSALNKIKQRLSTTDKNYIYFALVYLITKTTHQFHSTIIDNHDDKLSGN